MNQNHIQRVEKLAADAGETPHEFLTRIYKEERWLTRTATKLGMDFNPLKALMDKYGVKRRHHGGLKRFKITVEQIVSRKGAGERIKDIAAEVGCRPKYLSDMIYHHRKANAEPAALRSDYDAPAVRKVRVVCLQCDGYFMAETKFYRRCDACKLETEDVSYQEPSSAFAASNYVFL